MYGPTSMDLTPPPQDKHNYLSDPHPHLMKFFGIPAYTCMYMHEYHNTVHLIKISKSKPMGHIACFNKV